MGDSEFETLVNRALKDLPTEFFNKLENVSIVIQSWPAKHQLERQLKRGERGLLLGLYEGVPQTRRGSYGVGGALPDKITIFKFPLLMISKNNEEIEMNVRDTVLHEIAHHFGIDDERLDKIKNEKKEEGENN